jgi:hypothetical protein
MLHVGMSNIVGLVKKNGLWRDSQDANRNASSAANYAEPAKQAVTNPPTTRAKATGQHAVEASRQTHGREPEHGSYR